MDTSENPEHYPDFAVSTQDVLDELNAYLDYRRKAYANVILYEIHKQRYAMHFTNGLILIHKDYLQCPSN